jgi:hypothetical protein
LNPSFIQVLATVAMMKRVVAMCIHLAVFSVAKAKSIDVSADVIAAEDVVAEIESSKGRKDRWVQHTFSEQSLTSAEKVEESIIMSAETKEINYRLGDTFRGILCFSEHGGNKRYFKEKFPNSVMDKYFEALPSCYAQCKSQTGWQHFAHGDADGLPCGQQCTVREVTPTPWKWCPAGKEKKMEGSVPTRFEVLASVAKELSYTEETPLKDTLVVHLRLGDIVPVLDHEVDEAFRFDGSVMYQLSQDWVTHAAHQPPVHRK